MVPTPWRGRFFAYREVDGWRIPTEAEVSWILEKEIFVCWRGEITAFAVE